MLGAAERAGPVLVTALAVSLALLPALFIGNQPGLEVIYPLAVVVLGGLVTSTLIHLFVHAGRLPQMVARRQQGNFTGLR